MLVSKVFLADMVINGPRVIGDRREYALRSKLNHRVLGFIDAREAAKLIFPDRFGGPQYAEVRGVNPIY